MTSRLFRAMGAAIVMVAVAAWAEDKTAGLATAPAATVQTGSKPAPPATKIDERCPITVAQVNAAVGATLTQTAGSCMFFPANGRDVPHVFYILQNTMVCSTIQPTEMGFKEKLDGLPAKSAYVKDAIDGTHVLVCPNNGRGFDIVVDIKNDKAKNREAAIGLVKQVLGAK